MPQPEKPIVIFTVGVPKPESFAKEPVTCEFCGGTYYTSKENLAAARGRGMKIGCVTCTLSRFEAEGGEFKGLIHEGQFVDGNN
jgi:hypothetical protein